MSELIAAALAAFALRLDELDDIDGVDSRRDVEVDVSSVAQFGRQCRVSGRAVDAANVAAALADDDALFNTVGFRHMRN